MTATEPTFLETLTASTRKIMVAERVAARRGQTREVCDRLKSLVAKTAQDMYADRAALGMLWSELLYLDGLIAESLSVFKEVVETQLGFLITPVQLVAADNLSVLLMASWDKDATSTFYHTVDRSRISHFEISDSKSLLVAQTAIEKDRFTQALPLLWQSLVRAYALGSWRASRWAAERLAHLYLKAGDLDHACYYLIVAEADTEVKHLAEAISRRGDPAIISAILRQLMDFANLHRHFIIACKLIAEIPDLIPDSDVESLAKWLFPRCCELADPNGGGAMRAAWEAIKELGHRLLPNTSRQLIDAALTHPEWQAQRSGENEILPNRKVMVEAVTSLANSAPKEFLFLVAEGTLHLAVERFQDHDYPAVVNLLCNLSERGTEALRDKIKKALYVPGKPVNRMLAQAGGFFGIEALTPTQWEEFATRMVEEMLNTVQRLKPGEEAKPVAETLMIMTKSIPNGQLQITIQGGVGLHALIKGRQHLSEATIERIVRVLVEMATNRDNLLSNRELSLSHLCGFADRAQPGLRDEVVGVLERLARGQVLESVDYPNLAERQNPMAFKMNMGSPQQVQAMALVAAATYCGSDVGMSRVISEAIFEGFVSPHEVVRKGAYAAARQLPELTSEQLLPILMGLRDPNPEAAVAAFAAFAERKEWFLTRPMWKLYLLATRLACQSPNANLRRHAALALRSRLATLPTEGTRNEARAIMEVFSNDVAYSVRQVVTS